MTVHEGNPKLEQIARLLGRSAGRIEKWAELQPPFEFCSHPGVEPAGTAEKVGERIKGKIRDITRYDSRWGFRRVLSQLRLRGHQSIADAADRAVNDLFGTIDREAQETAKSLSQRIYYAAIVEQAKLSASQIRDAAAELEKVVAVANAEAPLNSINSLPSLPSNTAMNIPKPETIRQAIDRMEALKAELKEISRVDYYGEDPAKASLLCEKFKKLVWYCVGRPSLSRAKNTPITSLIPEVQGSFSKRLERLPRGCLSRLFKELIAKLTQKGVQQIVFGCTVSDLTKLIKNAAFVRNVRRKMKAESSCVQAQRDVEVILCQYEQFLSQREYLGESGLSAILGHILEAMPERLNRLDDAMHRLRVVERKLGVVSAEMETRSGGPNGQRTSFDRTSCGHIKAEFIRAAESFPKLGYVYQEWPVRGSAPDVPEEFMFDANDPSRNTIISTPSGRGDERMTLSWLLKPIDQHWQIEEARERLRQIVLSFTDFDTESEWLFSIRGTLRPRKCRLLRAEDAGKAKHFPIGRRACRLAKPEEAFFAVVEDLFQQCAIACGDRTLIDAALSRMKTDPEKYPHQPSGQGQGGETTNERIDAETTSYNPQPAKEPSKQALAAYNAYYGTGKTQKEVAAILTKQLRQPVDQGTVSRWIRKVKEWRRSQRLPVEEDEPKRGTVNLDGKTLDMGKRTDGRTTGDPRHRRTANSKD